ncbi:hypothetical protein D3C71_1695600 [compost metagenome]
MQGSAALDGLPSCRPAGSGDSYCPVWTNEEDMRPWLHVFTKSVKYNGSVHIEFSSTAYILYGIREGQLLRRGAGAAYDPARRDHAGAGAGGLLRRQAV